MTESLINMSIAGLLAGLIFSMPIAGPISILVTSNAFKGRLRYCNLVTIGASLADFVYVFIAIFGLTKLYSLYRPVIPYILIAGALFLLYMGYKTIRTKVDLEHLEDRHLTEKIKNRDKGGFYTGCMINFLNPTLFIGWLTSSFFVISLMASMGFNTGGLDTMINQNVKEINYIEGGKIEKPQVFSDIQLDKIRAQTKKFQKNDPDYPDKTFPFIYQPMLCILSFCRQYNLVLFPGIPYYKVPTSHQY